MSVYSNVAENQILISTIDDLAENILSREVGIKPDKEITQEKLEKAAWFGSLLANSEEDAHREKALTLAALIYVTHQDTEQEPLYRKYLYTILTRIGSIPTANAVAENSEKEQLEASEGGSILDSEIEYMEDFYRFDKDTIFTDFQEKVWRNLDEDYFVFSGPTSSGKSFLLQTYIEYLNSRESDFQGIYLVPSKALISEVTSEFRKKLDDEVRVLNGAYIDEVGENYLLVLTPERCLQLFDYENDQNVDFDLIFLDEIQELESDSRGPLFEDVMSSLEEIWGDAQILAAGPNISNPAEILEQVIQGDADEIQSVFSPTVQIGVSFEFRKRDDNIYLNIESPSGNSISRIIDRPTGISYSTVKGTNRELVKEFDKHFGGEGKTLVYASKTRSAESMAEGLANTRELTDVSLRCQNLIEYLEDRIHNQYSLAKTLENGVAFHHSGVPQVAREEIEALFKNGDISTICSTSTLLQGVNLPAEKMYIFDPSKGNDERLTDHEFENLSGRVGRVGEKMYGTVYYVEREDDKWTEEQVGNNPTKDVQSATGRAISESWTQLSEAVNMKDLCEIEDDGIKYTATLIRNKYIKNKEEFRDYLSEKDVSDGEISNIESGLSRLLDDIEIPKEILRKNPTVDPVLQNQLYTNVKANQSIWEIEPASLKDDFFSVTRKLNNVFRFAEDPEDGVTNVTNSQIRSHKLLLSLHQGYHWVSGKDYKQMIELRQDALNESNISTTIKNVMRIVKSDVQYLFVKYYKILCDILKSIGSYSNQFMLNFDKRLERGSMDSDQLKIMDLGIDRSIAITIDPPDDVQIEDYLEANMSDMDPLYQRHLRNAGIGSSVGE